MGSASSKFRKYLQSDNEVAALQLYQNNSDLRKALDPNCSYGDSHQHETPLHICARHGMRSLLRIFLYEKGGNPNKTNVHKETALHCVCMEKNSQFYNVQRRRLDCLAMVLKWKGATLQDEEVEKIDINAVDEKQNTALHYAAASGLKACVEMLVQYGGPLFLENAENQTPCDCAEQHGHSEIALYLESKMVFSNDGEAAEEDEELFNIPVEEYSGLRAQDLQEAKDQLLVETADMLSVPLFTAEALLRNHEWSREALLEAWMTNPVDVCEKSGVMTPTNLYSDMPEVQDQLNSPLPSPIKSSPTNPDPICDICTCSYTSTDETVHTCVVCDHHFCKECWQRYLNLKIQEGDAHHITCPAYDCSKLVPLETIEKVVSRPMAIKYLQFDIQAFVESNPDMKWCPYPGCGRAVKLPDLDGSAATNAGHPRIPSDTSRGVDCGNEHYFCWECLKEAHEPCSCDNWDKWYNKVAEVKPEQMSGTEIETESAANCLWLVTNSKPCPNCKSPIQKNEGCNHMKCSKCKHDFCWVCLEQWKRHNSSTGGYFKCNRYEVVKKVEEKTSQVLTEAEEKNLRMQELNRFVHYYTRFKNHENSFKLEEPLLKTARNKMMKLAEAVTDPATANAETKFVEHAVHQLLKARRVLKSSYVYGYYLDGPGYKKIVFEFMQTELEECTEILSQMVNRLYLRTPRKKIIEQALIVQRKRLEFLIAISKGLVPPETPPSLRKKRRRKYSMELEDEDLKKAIMASIKEVDPSNPWIKDASGRHTNVMAYLDWPAEDSDDSEADVAVTSLRKCYKTGCNRPRAPNPRTGEIHDYCSPSCQRADQEQQIANEQKEEIPEVILDEHMDLLRALEMSRLQYLRDTGLLYVPTEGDDSEPSTSGIATGSSPQKISSSQPTAAARPRSNSLGSASKANDLTPMEKLDIELQRVIEISSTIPKGVESESINKPDGQIASHHRRCSSSRFDENMSTIVQKVPNKSVEDLYCNDTTTNSVHPQSCTCEKCLEQLGACARVEGEETRNSWAGSSNTFGIIKDLSVSNIHSDDGDKMVHFTSKDFAAIFNKDTRLFPQTCKSNPSLSEMSPPESSAFLLPSTSSGKPREAWVEESPSETTNNAEISSEESSQTEESHVDKACKAAILSLSKHPEFGIVLEPMAFSSPIDKTNGNTSDKQEDYSEMSVPPDIVNDNQSFTNSTTHSDSGHVSLLEMAENLVQMTEEMNIQIQEMNEQFSSNGDEQQVTADANNSANDTGIEIVENTTPRETTESEDEEEPQSFFI
ncbi:hypothetical protein SNE40_022633 [Patella caerulea]|uniref:RBR-type E3 ubiquitin transferase n=1 Tax=Patella caerulea TaxID=87958 RepID=A0AAN8IW08_PATCE